MVDMYTNCLFNKIALGVYDGLDPVLEPAAGPDHDDWVQVGHDLLDGSHQGLLVVVRTCVGTPFNIAPDKIIHWIKVRTIRRPYIRGDH